MTHLSKVKVVRSVLGCAFVGLLGASGAAGAGCAESDSVTSGGSWNDPGASSGSGEGGRPSPPASASASTGSGAGGAGGEGGQGGVGGIGGAGGVGGVGGAGGQGGQGGTCAPTTETCNGADDDCNGEIDNGDPDGGGACDAAAPGECAKGTLHCVNAALECIPAMAQAEACDGLDNNCDGAVDEGDPGSGSQCVTQLLGVCSNGTTKCDGANGVLCVADVKPGELAEACDGLDNNCDGAIDEGDPGGGGDCSAKGFGECAKGKLHCENGALKCAPGAPQPEGCDGLDNNCDGNVDEGNPGGGLQCMTGLQGLCASGVTQCAGQSGVICQPTVIPGMLTEACNGLDDDCDGATDDGVPQVGQPCTAQGFVGVCQFGTYTCPSTAPFQLVCNHPAPGTVQEACNGKDDDCNGTIDDPALVNGIPCSTGLAGACSTGKTICAGGSLNCNPDTTPGSKTEICNNLDDNCNGQVDEMNPTPACSSQNPNAQSVQGWVCAGGLCQIGVCQAGHADINTAPGDGCECTTDSWSNACGVESSLAVPLGGAVDMVGKNESAAGSDWVTFNFTVPGVGAQYHPKVQLVDSAGGQYTMDVMVSCNGAAGCSTTGGANNENGINASVWEQHYNAYIPGPGCCSDNTPRVGSVKVRVYRKFGDAPTCASYKVTATNF